MFFLLIITIIIIKNKLDDDNMFYITNDNAQNINNFKDLFIALKITARFQAVSMKIDNQLTRFRGRD